MWDETKGNLLELLRWSKDLSRFSLSLTIVDIWHFLFDTSPLKAGAQRFFGCCLWQVEVQCLLLLEVLGGSHKQAVDGAVKKLNRLWKEVMFTLCAIFYSFSVLFCGVNMPCCFSLKNQELVDQYLSVILGLEPNQSYAAMLGLVVQFCTAQKEMDIIKRYKVNLLDSFFGGNKKHHLL